MTKAKIIKHLSRDKKFIPLIKTIAYPEIKLNEDLYASLISAIISQQLSVAAARTIHGRFLAIFNNKIPAYTTLISTSAEKLRTAGISNQKAGYLHNIAQFGLANSLHYNDLKAMEDEELITYLTQIKGVGKWTVEMILMFNLNRPDIFPIDDLGIQNAVKSLYNINATGRELKTRMLEKSADWSPYRTIACRYLWRWKDAPKN